MNQCCASRATDATIRENERSDGRDAPVDGLSAPPQTAAGDDDNDGGDGSAAAAPQSWTAAGDAVAAVADDGMDALDCYVMAYREDLAAGGRSAVDAKERPLSLCGGRRYAVLQVAAAPVSVGRLAAAAAGDDHSSGRLTIGWFGRLKRWLLRKDRVFAGKLHVRQVKYSKPPKRA